MVFRLGSTRQEPTRKPPSKSASRLCRTSIPVVVPRLWKTRRFAITESSPRHHPFIMTFRGRGTNKGDGKPGTKEQEDSNEGQDLHTHRCNDHVRCAGGLVSARRAA